MKDDKDKKPADTKGKAEEKADDKKATGTEAVDADKIYTLDTALQDRLFKERPWRKDPKYFKEVKISSVALIKMAMHAVSGGRLEVMGVLQGKIEEHCFIVMDCVPLGLGSETRVGMPPEMTEYLIKHLDLSSQVGKSEVACGWYHSHPGYGCWLSGIDVNTQKMNQKFQDPWLAIVIDPVQTIAKGQVELGAFRTYPDDYKDPDGAKSEFQAVPLDKIEDFGVHYNAYYPVKVSYFKTALDAQLLDLLWNKYWVNTLSANPLRATKAYSTKTLGDLALKMDKADAQAAHSRARMAYFAPAKKKEDSELSKIHKESAKTTMEHINGLLTQVIKNTLFNGSFKKADKTAEKKTT